MERNNFYVFKLKVFLIIFLLGSSSLFVFSQSLNFTKPLGVSGAAITPDPSSIIEIRTTTKGFLLPRMTSVQRDAIASPANGLLIYNTDLFALNYYDLGTTTWFMLGTATNSSSWVLGGNSPGAASVLGTKDNSNLSIETGTGTLNLGADAFAKSINIGTAAVTNVITVGNTSGASATIINTGTGGLTITTGAATNSTTTLGTTGLQIFESSTATSDKIAIQPQSTILSGSGTGTITSEDLTADQTWTMPNESGTVSLGIASVQVFTSGTAATYTTPVGIKAIMVEVVGGGGGSGSSREAITNNNRGNIGGAGGAGGYTRKLIVNPAVTYVYTVGAGGTAGTVGNDDSGTGGQSSFGIITALGGDGGDEAANAGTRRVVTGASGGAVGANGDIMLPGGNGGNGFVVSRLASAGTGGNSKFGGGSPGDMVINANTSNAGVSGVSYGGGASGAISFRKDADQVAQAGAAGFAGVIIVTEYR